MSLLGHRSCAIRTLDIFSRYDADLKDKLKCLKYVLTAWEPFTGRQDLIFFKSLSLSQLLYASTMKCQTPQILDQINRLHKKLVDFQNFLMN